MDKPNLLGLFPCGWAYELCYLLVYGHEFPAFKFACGWIDSGK
jgi:hypothetical protein